MAKCAAIVYNPVRMPRTRVHRAIERAEARHGWARTQWFATDEADSGRRATQRACASGAEVIIVAGGDGTVRIASEVMAGSGIPMALLPLGTGNLLARNLGVPVGDHEAAINLAFTGDAREIDMCRAKVEYADGEFGSHTFVVMAGIGLDASMAKETSASAKKRFGWAAYILPIARSILINRKFTLTYRIDDARPRGARAHTVIVGNCGTLTGNMLLLPDAELDDGLIDVVMLRPQGRFGWASIGTRLTIQRLARRSRVGREALANSTELKALAYAQGRQFDVRFDRPHEGQLDGDSIGEIIAARITVEPGALTVRV